ncbi:angiopoietin-related protein 1-like [Stylophora pistillata]|uniref:Angiopoietin-related protein 1 n=1 Tax=Stylophora pistillata TaxID=50429 RepID=A0A2B4R8L1_STYPI|nr:angiopoietin-related protein 1-like [Stylophora pistillata]PFX12562.1 Angiopoietin-related protein 1 [Stylophora pistillata]
MSVSQNSSLLLSVALLFMIQLLPTTHAAPTSCKNDSRKSEKFKNCAELYTGGQSISGVYTIDPDGSGAFDVYCDQTTAGGGWTVIQKRVDGTMDFNRTLNDYKKGFGDFLIREFWLGLDRIQRLTQNKTENKLRVDLGITADETVFAEYEWFGIENEAAYYKLHIGNISSGTASDSLSIHNGSSFYTWDRLSANSCPSKSEGGWWYNATIFCGCSNLNGIYRHRGLNPSIRWAGLTSKAEDTAPRTTEMKIRPVNFQS